MSNMSGFSSAGGSGSAPANPGDRRPLPASGLAAPSAPSAPALGPPPVPRFAPVSGAVPASRPSAATAGLSSSGTKKGRGKAPATPLPSIADHRSEEARVEFAGLDKKLDKIMSSLVGAVRTFRGLDSKLSPMVEGVDARIEAAEAKIASFAEELQLLKDAVAAGAAGTGPLPSAVAPTKRRQQDDDATMSGVPDFDNITNAPLPMAGEMNLQKFKDGIMETVDELMATTMTGIFDWTRGEIGRRINTASMSVACVAKLGGDQSRTPLEEAQLAMIERLQQNLDAYSTQHQELMRKYQSAIKINTNQMKTISDLQHSNQIIVQLRNDMAKQDNIISAQKEHIKELTKILERHALTAIEAQNEIQALGEEKEKFEAQTKNIESLTAELLAIKAVLSQPLL